jgi:hypothetical protein
MNQPSFLTMRNFILICTLLGSLQVLFAQSSITTLPCTHSCCFHYTLRQQQLYGFESDNDAKAAVNAIMRHTGLPANFKILAANVPNAAAVNHQNERYILYSQSFMLAMRDATKTNWSLVSILVHEIGHHLSGHTLDNMGSRPDKELEADRFSGFILYKMGATLAQAKIAIETIASEVGSETHPPKSARIAAITNGWIAAKDMVQKPIYGSKDTKPRNDTPALQFTDIGIAQNAVQNGQKGIRIRLNVTAAQGITQKTLVSAWFYDETGKPLPDSNKKYATTGGFVAVSHSVASLPKNRPVEVVLFIPYAELESQAGRRLKVNFGVHVDNKAVGQGSDYNEFEIPENL